MKFVAEKRKLDRKGVKTYLDIRRKYVYYLKIQ